MLTITIDGQEFFDEEKEEFVYSEPVTLELEHSLVSISKWEAKWKKPYLETKVKTVEESKDYIRCMTLTPDIPPETFDALSIRNGEDINAYIEDPMTATWFNDNKNPRLSSEKVTSELIYYWLIALDIPFECQHWHLNRLLTLIRICDIKNTPAKKMSKKELLASNSALNAQRRAALHSRG